MPLDEKWQPMPTPVLPFAYLAFGFAEKQDARRLAADISTEGELPSRESLCTPHEYPQRQTLSKYAFSNSASSARAGRPCGALAKGIRAAGPVYVLSASETGQESRSGKSGETVKTQGASALFPGAWSARLLMRSGQWLLTCPSKAAATQRHPTSPTSFVLSVLGSATTCSVSLRDTRGGQVRRGMPRRTINPVVSRSCCPIQFSEAGALHRVIDYLALASPLLALPVSQTSGVSGESRSDAKNIRCSLSESQAGRAKA